MKKTSVVWLVVIQFVLAYEWLHSGWGKWATSGFIDNIGKTLDGFITKNPNTGYAAFLQNTAVPNAQLFGNLIRIGELSVGIAFALGGILLLAKKRLDPTVIWLLVFAFLGGAIMNFNFYFAAGWLSPSTGGINLVMGLISLVFAVYYFVNRKELAS